MNKFLSLLLVLLPVAAGAAGPCSFDKPAARLAASVAEKPAGLEELFDRSVFTQISAARLSAVLSGLHRANGPVTAAVFVSSDGACGAHYLLETSLGYRVPAAFSLNPATGRLTGVFFGTAYKKDQTLAGVKAELKALRGRAGLLALKLGEKPSVVESLGEDEHFAVGSAFKLYVLGTLLEGKTPWDRVVKLREEDKSLPTGRLQNWPDGSPLTVHTLAAQMISESDNTASDALISFLGRRRIEAALPALGHSDPALLKPFLRTSEFFRLKADSEAALKYLNLPVEERYAFLDGLRGGPLPAAAALRQSPFGIDRIEWPVSPAELCRVLKYLLDKDSREALEILAMNKGLNVPAGFLYAGYKGGSEPGVLAMAWLLKDARSEWYCLAGVWNDEKEKLDQDKFFGIMQGALNALAERRPTGE